MSFKNKKSSKRVNISRRQTISNDEVRSQNMEIEGPSDGKFLPKFKIVNGPAYASALIYLEKDQEVYDNRGALNYADGSVSVNTKSSTGFLAGLARMALTSQSIMQTFYKGTRATPSTVCFASAYPGDMVAILIKPGDRYIMSSHGFVCATKNVVLETTFRFKNIFGGDSMFLSVATVPNKPGASDGMIWMASYGGLEHLTVPAGESVKVESGLFCVAKQQYKYNIAKMGGLKTFFLGDSGFFMEFNGPAEVYVHGRNFNHFVHIIRAEIIRESR